MTILVYPPQFIHQIQLIFILVKKYRYIMKSIRYSLSQKHYHALSHEGIFLLPHGNNNLFLVKKLLLISKEIVILRWRASGNIQLYTLSLGYYSTRTWIDRTHNYELLMFRAVASQKHYRFNESSSLISLRLNSIITKNNQLDTTN